MQTMNSSRVLFSLKNEIIFSIQFKQVHYIFTCKIFVMYIYTTYLIYFIHNIFYNLYFVNETKKKTNHRTMCTKQIFTTNKKLQ